MLRGKIEGVRRGELVGWLWDEAHFDKHVEFELAVNGEIVGAFVARDPREDLRVAGIGKGDHSFRVKLDPKWQAEARPVFSVHVGGRPAHAIQPWSPKPANEDAGAERARASRAQLAGLEAASPSPGEGGARVAIRGRLERVTNGELFGWLWNTASAEPVRFVLLVNDKPVGEFLADQRRGDLVRAGIGTGAHAFRIPLKVEWLQPGDNPIAVRILPDQRLLADRLVVQGPTENLVAQTAPLPAELQPTGVEDKPAVQEPLMPREVVPHMQQWSTNRLISFQQTFEKDLLLERAKKLFREKKWDELAKFYVTAAPDRKGRSELDALIGRGLLYGGKPAEAATVLAGAAAAVPNNAAIKFYTSVAFARADIYDKAVEWGRAALALEPDNPQYLIDHATHCRRLGRMQDANISLRKSLLSESTDSLRRAMAISDNRRDYCLYTIARNQVDLDSFAEAAATIEQLLVLEPDHVDAMILLSQAFVALNRIRDALRLAERVLELDPLRQGPRFQLRSLQMLVQDEEAAPPRIGFARWNAEASVLTVCLAAIADDTVSSEQIGLIEYSADPSMALASLGLDWLLLPEGADENIEIDVELYRRVEAAIVARAGLITTQTANYGRANFWRRELLVGLAESGIISSIGTIVDALSDVASVVETIDLDAPKMTQVDLPAACGDLQPGPVIAMSRHGIVKFGGGEQFLDSMAEHYKDMGFDPIVVGTRPERIGEEGVENGRQYAFVDMNPTSLRAYFLRVRPSLVHVLSGLGFQVAEALDYLTIPFVYGVHFWRDCLGAADDDSRFFLAHDRGPIPKPAFRYVLEKASTVYSNSEYTRAILEEAFSVRTPVIYSLPREAEDQTPGTDEEIEGLLGDWRDYILLVNAKSDKGFNLLVDTAKAVPQARFLAVASQSDRTEADAAIRAAGIGNMRIIGHTNRMDILYSNARAVAVASYRFVETFSRVCIEAQRYGKPVLGSTIGNVPFLLKSSGVILPEAVEDWAAEVARIYEDQTYYQGLCDAARVNSERYGYKTQVAALGGMISTVSSGVLIGVGSGIGNMLHVAPMIRNISRRLGRKVDLVMTEDHKNSLFLLQNDEYVNAVYSVRQEVLRRKYDTVLITHSFGNARLPFQAKRVLYSRDWLNFEPGGEFHETIYNLEAAKALLGIPYDEEDVGGYYLGNFKYTPPPPGKIRIGIHGGSKDGFWRSKRWPGHSELAQRLQAKGYAVASFGIPEEYVPGTEDMTGGTISEMVEHMLGLHYFISNDSGLMNITNALGIPVMGLFAPTNPLTRGPIGPKSRWLAIEKDCSPCEVTKIGRETFHSGNCACIAELSLDKVEAAVLQHMQHVLPTA